MKNAAKFGWTVVFREPSCLHPYGFHVYKRTTPADAEHCVDDLAPFTFATKALATEQGKLGNYAYKR